MPRPVRRATLWALALCLCGSISLADAANRKVRREAAAQAPPPIESALLMEADTGEILYEKDSRKKRQPASMVKMMVMLIVMEKVRAGEIGLGDTITASARASKIGGSQIYLREGETFALEDMLKAIVIASANDASVAVAEQIAGTVEGFVELMNERAHDLNMTDSHFESVHGLPPTNGTPGDLTSAHDLALLARELVKYPELLSWGGTKEDSLRDGKFILTNTNKLVHHFPGIDGLKTGFYREAGFNVTATAQRGGLRFIAVVMGAPSSGVRFDEAKRLLAMGFNGYKKVVFVRKDAPIGPEIRVSGSTVRKIRAVAQDDLTIVVKKGLEKQLVSAVQLPPNISAPAHRGQPIGEVWVKHKDQVLGKTSAVVPEEIPQVGMFWRIFGR
ncbi:MAG: D-alanyl-D-alanine carboxypeptidase [Nitrospinae bacterium]|nr:D-alanyl-D-alanine carboxypeptidase [Nitrospinota bacterium]